LIAQARSIHAKITLEELPMADHENRIIIDPKILVGKPVIRGTRIAVEFIIDLLAEGWTQQQILTNYPHLQADDITACLHYAGSVLRQERVYPIPAA
jgi:uncharacterized protein (DUF433 family)